MLRYGSAPQPADSAPTPELAYALLSWEQHGHRAVAYIQLAGRLTRGQAGGSRSAHGAQRAAALLAAVEAGAPVEVVLGMDWPVSRVFAAAAGVGRKRCRGKGFRRPRTPPDRGPRRTDRVAHRRARPHRPCHRDQGAASSYLQPHLYSRTATFARSSPPRSTPPTRCSCSTFTRWEQPLPGVSGATIAEHVSVLVRYIPDFLGRRRAGRRDIRAGDVVVTMGGLRRDDAGRGDRRRAAGLR